MRCFDNGIFFTVLVESREVEDFASSWPCAGLEFAPVYFQFDKRNGDLVDTNDQENHPGADGSAICALADDAKAYGAKRLRLTF